MPLGGGGGAGTGKEEDFRIRPCKPTPCTHILRVYECVYLGKFGLVTEQGEGCVCRMCVEGSVSGAHSVFYQTEEGLYFGETEAGLVVSWIRGYKEVWVSGQYRNDDLPGPFQGKDPCDNQL